MNETINVGGEIMKLAAWAAADGRVGIHAMRGPYEEAAILTIMENGDELWRGTPQLIFACGKLQLVAGEKIARQEIPEAWSMAMKKALEKEQAIQKKLAKESRKRNRGGGW